MEDCETKGKLIGSQALGQNISRSNKISFCTAIKGKEIPGTRLPINYIPHHLKIRLHNGRKSSEGKPVFKGLIYGLNRV